MAKDPGNTSATLDAAEWTYNFEKARIKGTTDNNVINDAQIIAEQTLPSNLEYIDDDYDPFTGTSATAFRDKTTGEVIVAYTGTNKDSDAMNDIVKSDVGGILFGMGGQYQPAYDFYKNIADKYGAENIVVTGHSLGGNVAQRVALKYNAQNTVVYNSSPLYIPNADKGVGSSLNPTTQTSDAKHSTLNKISNKKSPFLRLFLRFRCDLMVNHIPLFITAPNAGVKVAG